MLPETLEWLRHTAKRGQTYSLAHLDHVERMDALCESLVAAMKRIAALECRFVHGAPLFTGPLPAGATWTEKEGGEVFTARPASCSAAEAGEPSGSDDFAGVSNMVPAAPSAPAAAAAPEATDEELMLVADAHRLWSDARRALYYHGRQHGTPPAVVEALRKAEAALSGAALASSQALNALPAIRAALQLLGQPAPAAAPEPIELQAEARPEVVGFIPDEDAAPAGGLPPGWRAVAAAIRALVDQVLPDEGDCWKRDMRGDAWIRWEERKLIRAEIFAIAAELEGGATTTTTPQEAQ